MIKSVLVEDDLQSIESIKSLIQYYNVGIELVGIAQTIETAKEIIESTKPDLLLLDIELPDGTSLDLLRKLSYKPWVIFITGHTDYIFESLDFPTIHYLVKPLSVEKFSEAIRKYNDIIQIFEKTKKSDQEKLKIKKYFEKIAIPNSSGLFLVEVSKIVRLEGQGNYTYFFLSDGQKILISRTLSSFEEFLPDDVFIRVHKSHMINIGYIKSVTKSNPSYVVLTNNTEIPISTGKKEILIEKLQQNIVFFS